MLSLWTAQPPCLWLPLLISLGSCLAAKKRPLETFSFEPGFIEFHLHFFFFPFQIGTSFILDFKLQSPLELSLSPAAFVDTHSICFLPPLPSSPSTPQAGHKVSTAVPLLPIPFYARKGDELKYSTAITTDKKGQFKNIFAFLWESRCHKRKCIILL